MEDETGHTHRCTAAPGTERAVCGDRVRWVRTGGGLGLITAIEPRHSLLARPDFHGHPRPLAANLDRVYVVIAPVPAYRLPLVDRYLVAAEHFGLAAAIVVNKVDLLGARGLAATRGELALYEDLGYPVITASAGTDHGLDALRTAMADCTGILVGQSGVGKSSVTRRLVPGLDIAVGELSGNDSGRHTTTATTLYHVPGGGAIIDSPGVRDFGLWHFHPADVARGFVEIRDLVSRCRFRDCRHGEEPGCAVTAAAAAGLIDGRRLESYRGILEGLERQGANGEWQVRTPASRP